MNYIITIGREYGSGGRYIGEELAKRLHIHFYDHSLLEKVVEHSGFCMDYVKENDEKKENFFSYFSFNGSYNDLSASQKVSIAEFNTIKKIAETESCVIVGRCADYVLKDYPNVVNVFIYAKMEDKVKRAVKYYGIDEKKAEEIIMKKNKMRASYYNFYTNQKWGKASCYDICLDSSIGICETVEVILQYVQKKLQIKE